MTKTDQSDDQIRDKVGNEITLGCFVVYGHALGRSSALRIGKVLKMNHVREARYGTASMDHYRITVQSIDDDWSSQTPALTQKKGTLLFPDRMIVLPPSQVPELYRELLSKC